MENIKISDEDKKILNKYNHLLMAVVGEDGLVAYGYVSEDEGLYDFVTLQPAGPHGWERRNEIEPESEGYKILYDTIEEFLQYNSNEFSDYLYCDDCIGYGMVNAIYNPFNSTLKVDLDITVRGEEEHYNEFTFEQLKNQPNGMWGQTYNELKKLGNPEFIEKMKQDYGNTLELTYDGGGDSGQINDYGDTNHGSVHIERDIEYVGYEVIDIYYSGWENNEGGDGRIIFDFENQTVKLYHTYYVENSDNEYIGEFKIV
jgi:hypothetical protein